MVEIHSRILDDMKADPADKTVTMMQDGCSDIHNTPVIASSNLTGEKSYFVSAVDTERKKILHYSASLAKYSMCVATETFGVFLHFVKCGYKPG